MSQIKRYYFDREYLNNYWILRVGFGVKLKPQEVHFIIWKQFNQIPFRTKVTRSLVQEDKFAFHKKVHKLWKAQKCSDFGMFRLPIWSWKESLFWEGHRILKWVNSEEHFAACVKKQTALSQGHIHGPKGQMFSFCYICLTFDPVFDLEVIR